MPPEMVEVYFDDVVVLAPVIRALPLTDRKWECLILIGDELEYQII